MGVRRFHISAPVIAIMVSAAIHAGLFTAAHFMPLKSPITTPPVIEIPQGEHAIQVTIVSATKNEVEQDAPPSVDEPDTQDHSTPTENIVATHLPAHRSDDQPVALQSQATEPQVQTDEPRIAETEVEPVHPPPPVESNPPKPPTKQPSSPTATVIPQKAPSVPTERVQSPPTEIARKPSAPPPASTPPPPAPKAPGGRSRTKPPVAKKQFGNQQPGVKRGAKVLNLPRPVYPSVSRRQGEQGLVVLRVEVLSDGTIGKVKTLSDAGFPRLARAAVKAVRKARFRPATLGGRPVKDTVRVPFRFVLR